jgi:dCTP deaminase
MTVMSDRWIRERALADAMIEPFVESQRRDGCISYGLSSYGYDARVADEFKVFTNIDSVIVDPKDFAANSFVDRKTDVCIIPPNSFALARTVEYFRVPRDVLVICLGKSTYARCGIIVNVTPLEPGWEGHVTLEFSNTTPLPSCSSRGTSRAKPVMPTGPANTWGSAGSHCPAFDSDGPVTSQRVADQRANAVSTDGVVRRDNPRFATAWDDMTAPFGISMATTGRCKTSW